MYRNIRLWSYVRSRILIEGASRRQVARQTGVCRNTVKKMLLNPYPQPSAHRCRAIANDDEHHDKVSDQELSRARRGRAMSLVRLKACRCAYDILRAMDREKGVEFLDVLIGSEVQGPAAQGIRQAINRAVAGVSIAPTQSRRQRMADESREWILLLRAGAVNARALEGEFADLPEWPILRERMQDGNERERQKAMVVLCIRRGLGNRLASESLGLSRNTYLKYRKLHASGGTESLFRTYNSKVLSKSGDQRFRNAVFELLHEPPSAHGINRTSWKLDDLLQVLNKKGLPLCRDTLSKIIQSTGFRWRHARVVLTSSDPSYREKLDKVREILERLGGDEAFFSIDEYGPFAVKMKPGKALTPPGEQRVVPQYQKSKGCMIMTAALELSGNQVTHFYSDKKNTAEMIRMMNVLIERYRDRKRIYLSWDAASWHISKELNRAIDAHNADVATLGGPIVDVAPLPAGAQFLNVIESVFSGMSRAIIHNSDYATLDDAKSAIDRYFDERNAAFLEHPQRAGNKIWGKERGPACFSEANNCKDPRYR